MLLNSSRRCNCLVIFYVIIFFNSPFGVVWSMSLLYKRIFIIIVTWVAGIDGYCFSGSPSLTCIGLKFDVYVYL